jgi:hypothetical protein
MTEIPMPKQTLTLQEVSLRLHVNTQRVSQFVLQGRFRRLRRNADDAVEVERFIQEREMAAARRASKLRHVTVINPPELHI